MNNFKQSIIMACLAGCLFGCAIQPSNIWYHSTDELITENNYLQAIKQLEQNAIPDIKLIEHIKLLASQYTQAKLHAINELNNQKQWGKSLQEIDKLYTQVPDNQPIKKIETVTKTLMDESLRKINTQVAIQQAQLLQLKNQQIDIFGRSNIEPFQLQIQQQQLQLETQALAKQLIELSIQAIAQSDYDDAAKTYALATRFNPTLGKAQLNRTINQGLSHNRTKSLQTRQANLLIKLNHAIAENEIDDVIAIEHILSKPPFQGPDVRQALKNVTIFRQRRGEYFDVMADSQYRNGQLQDAINNWKNALELIPKQSQITNKLQRAQKVFEKMELLRH